MLIAIIMNGISFGRLHRVLFDSGGTFTMLVNRRCLPKGCTPATAMKPILTVIGNFKSNQTIHFQNCVLPEFDRNKGIHSFSTYVFDSSARYDIIISRDVMHASSWYYDHVLQDQLHSSFFWMDREIPMKDRIVPSSHQMSVMPIMISSLICLLWIFASASFMFLSVWCFKGAMIVRCMYILIQVLE